MELNKNSIIIRAAIIAAPIFLIIVSIISTVMLVKHKPSDSNKVSSDTLDVFSENVTFDNSNEIRAMWISFLELQSILKGKSETQFKESIGNYFDNIKASHFNTVIFHARSHGDAYYKSSLFPTSVNFTVTRGLSAPFDPLAIAIDEAHKRSLRLEAWVNPYRGPEVKENEPLCPDAVFAKWLGSRRVFTAQNGGKTYHYLNPAHPDAQQLALDGVIEILENYDIDGIHFDDYFYPVTDEYIDSEEYASSGSSLSLSDYRRSCVSDFVAKVYKTVKKYGKTFGISPSGNIEHNQDLYFADIKLWASKPGYVDYLCPQLYWGYGEGSLPYETVLSDWESLVKCKNVGLLVGLAAYKVGTNEYWQEGNTLARQAADAAKCDNYGGFAVFRYDYFFDTACAPEAQNLTNQLTKNNLQTN